MKKPYLIPLDKVEERSPHQIRKTYGGKALGLIEAKKLNIFIPETWLIGCEHFDSFGSQSKDFLKKASEYISAHFESELNALPDTLFAVRSSSQTEDQFDHSFAGIFESQLHVLRKDLPIAIARVWDSCHSLRSASYSEGIGEMVSMGVLIQPMIETKYAGVAFSKHPSPSNVFENHHLVVEFSSGDGEKIVQGEITPSRLTGNLETILNANETPWAKELLTALVKLKEFHHYDVDLEFVVDKRDQFILVQQRPVSRSHPSHLLDLTDYVRKYKRSLFSLDIEMLIRGCACYLSPYLELPFQLERWMVMVRPTDDVEELWVHRLLDQAVTLHLTERIHSEPPFLERIESRYRDHVERILDHNYNAFFDKELPLHTRFSSWYDFVTPLHAHYYVPIFMIEALHGLLLKSFQKIDPLHAEEDLFFLGTTEIASLMDLLQNELAELHGDRTQLSDLKKRYGFLKCRQVFETGYSEEELLKMAEDVVKRDTTEEKLKWHALLDKYVKTPQTMFFFEKFREWMRIRNQDMEYLMYAILETRPLLEEVATYLEMDIKEVWQSSSELILRAIERNEPRIARQLHHDHLAIYHSFGKTRLNNHLVITEPTSGKKEIHGKKVWGEGSVEGTVVVAFSPHELQEKGPLPPSTILVTGMTTPDFIPFLKGNIKALVTDEGGILCHAAIVARELSLPCIVGTGCATDLLKGGMEVEINLDRGEISRR